MAGSNVVTIHAADSFVLSGTLYTSQESGRKPLVVLAPATGTTQNFYSPFSAYLSERGLPCLTFDYRFTGTSFPSSVDPSNKNARIAAVKKADVVLDREWVGDLDAAVLFGIKVALREGRQIVVLAHSLGGHLFPLLPASTLGYVQRVLFVTVISPYHGHYPDPGQRRRDVQKLLDAATALGYFPSADGGLGTEVPYGTGTKWSGWMEYPNYWAHDHHTKLSQVTTSILSLCFTDDWITLGNAAQSDAILECIPNAAAVRISLDPVKLGWPSVSHVGMFAKRHREPLWRMFGDFCEHGGCDAAKDMGEVRFFNLRAKL